MRFALNSAAGWLTATSSRWDNHKYEGEWAHDQPSGAAVEAYPDGSTYEGEIFEDLRHGLGSYGFISHKVFLNPFYKSQLP